ncbi:MAG TPA: hypothetical protein VIJ48_07240 [Acidimicrobiia bacterium]
MASDRLAEPDDESVEGFDEPEPESEDLESEDDESELDDDSEPEDDSELDDADSFVRSLDFPFEDPARLSVL